MTTGPAACDVFALSVDVDPSFWKWPRTGRALVSLDGYGDLAVIYLIIRERNPDGTVGSFVAGSGGQRPLAAAIIEPVGDYYVFAIGVATGIVRYEASATLQIHDGPPPAGLGRPFEPRPISRPLFGVQAPDADPARQRHVIEAADGADLYVEAWVPTAKDGNVPPRKLPTILIMTPYVSQGVPEYLDAIQYFVPRGYAVAQHNVRGTGESGGCLEQTGPAQIDDGARVVEFLGRDAPWSDGSVGMYGISYDAETQISVAGLGDPARTRYLKAIVPAASVGGQYEYSYFDGVPYSTQALASNGFYLLTSAMPGGTSTPGQYLQKVPCQPDVLVASADQSGNLTPYYRAREYRPGASNIRAATLMVHGLADFNVLPLTEAGFFERLPDTMPHKGLFGIWEHAFPDHHAVRSEWSRIDWRPMSLAWFDRYLRGLPTGVEAWPAVQVQGNDGLWRAEPDWPTTGGPVGHLALGPSRALGSATPTGATAYTEGGERTALTGGRAVFELIAPGRLEITGQPVLDLWVSLDRPDAHIVGLIETFDAKDQSIEAGVNFGMRSARHLDPLVENRFAQLEGKPAPTNTPIRVSLRFLPTDLVIPKGGKLHVSISGSLTARGNSTPSGSATTVTILHDCDHPSALRFLMPRPDPDLLSVRDVKDAEQVAELRLDGPLSSDGGGLAIAPVCGRRPLRLANFGPPIDYQPAPARVLGRNLPATGVQMIPVEILLVVLAGLARATRRSTWRPGIERGRFRALR